MSPIGICMFDPSESSLMTFEPGDKEGASPFTPSPRRLLHPAFVIA